jgi:dihydrofolate synthase/folylpolyglutamate synthase
MTTFTNETEAITYIFRSMRKLRGHERGPDDVLRDPGPTRRMLTTLGLLDSRREYTVVTGSKGKGSTTVITARLLQHLGHRVGTITSPHLITWRERIRVDGQAIPEGDFLRILGELAPHIDAVEDTLTETQYFSPQGIFLAAALRWFDEQDVAAAVLEVGRGGRFDDIAVVPNKLSLFTPITLEHVAQLGPSLERIAWHKAGIIKPSSHAYSVPQAPEVMEVLAREAEAQDAQFDWIAPLDMGRYLGNAPNGIRMELGRYGEVLLSLHGRYQIMNATLAVIAAGNVHARLPGIAHSSPEYVQRIREGLADIRWPGRCQKLQDRPAVYIDGAINGESARMLVESLRDDLLPPVVSIIAVPADKDYAGVYAALGPVSDAVILTETTRNPSLIFPDAAQAMQHAAIHNAHVSHIPRLEPALDDAMQQVGREGTILIVGTQSILADAAHLWGLNCEVI